MSGGGTGEYLALLGWVLGAVLLVLGCWWGNKRDEKLVDNIRRQAVELRRTPQAPARPAPTGHSPGRPVGALSSRAGVAPDASARPPTPADADVVATAASAGLHAEV